MTTINIISSPFRWTSPKEYKPGESVIVDMAQYNKRVFLERCRKTFREAVDANAKCAQEQRTISTGEKLSTDGDLVNTVGEWLPTVASLQGFARVSSAVHCHLSMGISDGSTMNGALALRQEALRKYVREHGFGAQAWNRYFNKPDSPPAVASAPLPLAVLDELKNPCPFNPGKSVEETHILVYIPTKVNGVPLTFNNLEKLSPNPDLCTKDRSPKYSYVNPDVRKLIGEVDLEGPCWILITKKPMPGSLGKSFEEQQELIPSGYQLASPLEIAASCFMHHIATGERLLDSVWTRCGGPLAHGRWPVAVGVFAGSGLDVSSGDDYGCVGVVPLRKFTVIGS